MSGHVLPQSCIATHPGPQGAQGSELWTPSGSGFEDFKPKWPRVRSFGPCLEHFGENHIGPATPVWGVQSTTASGSLQIHKVDMLET